MRTNSRSLFLPLAALLLALALSPTAFAQSAIEKRITISLPKGNGPFPAVILMHWTNGPGRAEKKWSRHLNANGIAAVTLKSYSRISGSLESYEEHVPTRVGHLKQAFGYIRNQDWNNGKVSVLGRSHGAWAVIDALQAGALGSGLHRAVAAAPRCEGKRSTVTRFKSKTPLLIVVGTRDKAAFAKKCLDYGAKIQSRTVQMKSFKSGHSVDLDAKQATQTILGFLK